jgi:type I restriction enzyme S subunit
MMQLDDLPTNWKLFRFDEVLLIRKGNLDPALTPSEEFELFSIPALDESGEPEIKLGHQIGSSKVVVRPGDCLFSKLNPRIPRTWVVPPATGRRQIASTEFWPLHSRFQPDEEGYLAPEFLKWLFRCSEFLNVFRGDVAGGVQSRQRLQQDAMRAIQIPTPPPLEQRRLVASIEALASRIEQAEQAREAATAEASSLVRAAVTSLFAESDCWKFVRDAVSQKKGAVRNGPFGSQLLHHEFTDSGVAAIGTRDVQTNSFELKSGWYVSPEKFEQFRRYQVFPKDVLCTIVGASIGRFAVVPDDVPLAFTTKHVQALTLDLGIAVPGFVSLMLNFHPRCRESMFAQVDGSAQPSLNANKVLNTELPLPPVAEQRRVLSRLDALASKQLEVGRLQCETEAELAAFMPAVLASAFGGEL